MKDHFRISPLSAEGFDELEKIYLEVRSGLIALSRSSPLVDLPEGEITDRYFCTEVFNSGRMKYYVGYSVKVLSEGNRDFGRRFYGRDVSPDEVADIKKRLFWRPD